MIQKKLLEIQKENIWVKKDAKNPFFKSEYTTLDEIVDTFSPILNEKNIVVYHESDTEKWSVTTYLYDVDSDTKVSSSFPILQSNDPQKIGSAITYGKRYNLWQLLNITTEKDDDWNKAASKDIMDDKIFNWLVQNKDYFETGEDAYKAAAKKYDISEKYKENIYKLYK